MSTLAVGFLLKVPPHPSQRRVTPRSRVAPAAAPPGPVRGPLVVVLVPALLSPDSSKWTHGDSNVETSERD